jgi:glycerol uptake facilitator-like aquaporin
MKRRWRIVLKKAGVMNSLGKKLAAEFLGTFWLTFGGCGSAVLAAAKGGGVPAEQLHAERFSY